MSFSRIMKALKRVSFLFSLTLAGCHCSGERCFVQENFFERNETPTKKEKPWDRPQHSVSSILDEAPATEIKMGSSVLRLSTSEPDKTKIRLREKANAPKKPN